MKNRLLEKIKRLHKMNTTDGFEQYRILLKELSKPKVDYKKLKSGIKEWLKSLSTGCPARVNRKFLERLRCKGFTYTEVDNLISKVVIAGDHSVLWSKIARVIKFESRYISERQTLRDVVIRLINAHKSLVTTTGKFQRKILVAKFVGLLGLLLVIFYSVNSRNIMNGGFIPLSKYIDTEVPEFKVESTTECGMLWDEFWNAFTANNNLAINSSLNALVAKGCISAMCKDIWIDFINCWNSPAKECDFVDQMCNNNCFEEPCW